MWIKANAGTEQMTRAHSAWTGKSPLKSFSPGSNKFHNPVHNEAAIKVLGWIYKLLEAGTKDKWDRKDLLSYEINLPTRDHSAGGIDYRFYGFFLHASSCRRKEGEGSGACADQPSL
jgi:hypothetical protein